MRMIIITSTKGFLFWIFQIAYKINRVDEFPLRYVFAFDHIGGSTMKRYIAIPMAFLAVLMFAGLSFSADMSNSGKNFFPNRDDQNYLSITPKVADQGHQGLAPAWSGNHGSSMDTNSGKNFFPNRDDQNYISATSRVADHEHYGVAPAWGGDRGSMDKTSNGKNFFPNRDDQNLY